MTTTPQEEAASLRKEPLPPGPEDDHLLARIRTIDFLIKDHERDLAELQRERSDAMARVIELGIREQDSLELKFKYRTDRVLDVEAFKQKYPEETKAIIESLTKDMTERAAHIGDSIPLRMADAMVGRDKVTALCHPQVAATPYVTRKEVKRNV